MKQQAFRAGALPQCLRKLARNDRPGWPVVRYVPIPGVRPVTGEEERAILEQSQWLYPSNRNGTIDWEDVPDDLVLTTLTWDLDQDPLPDLWPELLRLHAPEATSLALVLDRSLIVEVQTATAHQQMAEIAATSRTLLVFSGTDGVVLEFAYPRSSIVVARVPDEPLSPRWH